MTSAGQSPENPMCVASAVVLSPDRHRMLVGARLETANEARHLGTVSSITRGMPRAVFNLLAGGNPRYWKANAEELLHQNPGTPVLRVGRGEHYLHTDVFVVETVLGKVGLAGALVDGAITGVARPALRSLTHVPDKDTGKSEWTAMLHYEVTLDSASDLSRIPHSSPAYDPIAWVDAAGVPGAFAANDVGKLGNPELDAHFLCITGACMSGAARILAPHSD